MSRNATGQAACLAALCKPAVLFRCLCCISAHVVFCFRCEMAGFARTFRTPSAQCPHILFFLELPFMSRQASLAQGALSHWWRFNRKRYRLAAPGGGGGACMTQLRAVHMPDHPPFGRRGFASDRLPVVADAPAWHGRKLCWPPRPCAREYKMFR